MTKTTKNFGDVIRDKLASDADLQERVEREAFNIDVAAIIYNARKSKNLTQTQLANKVGTSQSVIARMEDADYGGHSLKMLRRIAKALDCNLGIEFYSKPSRTKSESVKSHEIAWPNPAEYGEDEIVFDFEIKA